ncbi:MAG: response regulator [Colwellia sp.]|nr:response regulator [Colwellia sp.]
MPEMDGYEITAHIRKAKISERYKNIIIIAMTANAMPGDRQKCLNSGMNDYISKPIDAEKLFELLRVYLT